MPLALAVSFGAFASALVGGWLAMRALRYVGVIIAIGAGIRIGAAFFDLIPESVEHLGSIDLAMVVITAIAGVALMPKNVRPISQFAAAEASVARRNGTEAYMIAISPKLESPIPAHQIAEIFADIAVLPLGNAAFDKLTHGFGQ